MTDIGALYLSEIRQRMRLSKELGDRALAQLPPDSWHKTLAPEGNSAAVLVQHVAGNLRWRWGGLRGGYLPGVEAEPAERRRDTEFEDTARPADELLAGWEEGWQIFLDALDHLTPADLARPLTIRGEPYTVLAAVERGALHIHGHMFQLVLLVKTLRGADFETLSILRGGSDAYNAEMREQQGADTDGA